MEKWYYYPGKFLSYFLGFSFLISKSIIIISPWISDIPLEFPFFSKNKRRVRFKRMRFSEFINSYLDNLEVKVKIIIHDNEWNRKNFISKIKVKNSKNLKIILKKEFIHAKSIITDLFVYEGSANITVRGLMRYREICKLFLNEYGNSEEFFKRKYISLIL